MNGSWQDEHVIKILETTYLTHNVKRFRTTKPEGYEFIPGEATDIVINQPAWKGNRHAFTFTGLNEWPFLEFSIKIYRDHNGFTSKLDQLEPGDTLIIHDSFGHLHYRGEGTFIAGGAGVTPFIAVLRQLAAQGKISHNQLLLSNKTSRDIILKKEFESLLGNRFINTLTKEKNNAYHQGRVDRPFLKEYVADFSTYFYICGSVKMMQDIRRDLIGLGAAEEKIIIEMDFTTWSTN